MITAETGVYLQFFDEGESFDNELPPIGPFELLIIRHNRIIGDREHVEHDMLGAGSVERWLEAELELRRALGDEPGGVKRAHMRIRAPRGDIIVRFYDYAGDEAPKVPELGPFYAITVGKREVRADDKLLAIRATDMSPWTLTDSVRPGIAGINKADFSVFSLSARDPRAFAPPSPDVAASARTAPAASSEPAPAPVEPTSAAPQAEFVERRKVNREVYVARPDPKQDETLTPADVNLILRVDKLKQQELAEQLMIERLRREQHVSPEAALRTEALASVPMRFQPPVKERAAAEAAAAEEEEEGELPLTERILAMLWAGRLFIVTGLLLIAAISAYGYLKPRATAGNAPPLTFAATGEKVTAAGWQYSVVSVERPVKVGTTPATTGGYLIVHVTVSRKDPDAPIPDPSDFVLIDTAGARTLAFSATSDVYGPATGITWATRYALNASVQDFVVFDANPSSRGLLLLIRPANVEVRLPDP